MIALDFKPDEKKLRQYGWAGLVGFTVLGILAARKTDSLTLPIVLWALAVIHLILALTAPKLLKPLYVLLMVITFPIGFIVGNLVMGLLYFGMFTPIALVFKLKGRDLLNRKLDRDAKSYWIDARPKRPSSDYYRQF